MIEITVPIDQAYPRFEAQLGGTTYAFELEWNRRASLWFMSLYLPGATADERVPILLGQAMVAQRPLLAGVVAEDRPSGELYIRATRDPQRLDWGTTALLLFIEPGEFPEEDT